jgi:MerR family redox-sensitive transcriptional activator SoxR
LAVVGALRASPPALAAAWRRAATTRRRCPGVRVDEGGPHQRLPPPRRVQGRRRYAGSVPRRLAVVAVAQVAGLTVAEIRELFHGCAAETPAFARWQTLAAQTLVAVEALIARAEGMRRRLTEMVARGCPTLDECGSLLLGRAPRQRSSRASRQQLAAQHRDGLPSDDDPLAVQAQAQRPAARRRLIGN